MGRLNFSIDEASLLKAYRISSLAPNVSMRSATTVSILDAACSGNGRTLITKIQLLGSSLARLQAQREREIHWVSVHSLSACVYQLMA
jgi:hypothetical protein